MNSAICKCCGQPVLATEGDVHNPNMCVACSNVEGIEEPEPPQIPYSSPTEETNPAGGNPTAFAM